MRFTTPQSPVSFASASMVGVIAAESTSGAQGTPSFLLSLEISQSTGESPIFICSSVLVGHTTTGCLRRAFCSSRVGGSV